jgi:hypothetical protein
VKNPERIASILISLAGLWVMYYAWDTLKLGSVHMPDAGLLPFLCGAGLTILSIIWFVILREKKTAQAPDDGEERFPLRPYISLALMVGYGLLLETLGYISSTVIFMVAWQQIVEREKWVKTIIITVLGTAAMYALFSLFLKVPIPGEFFLR